MKTYIDSNQTHTKHLSFICKSPLCHTVLLYMRTCQKPSTSKASVGWKNSIIFTWRKRSIATACVVNALPIVWDVYYIILHILHLTSKCKLCEILATPFDKWWDFHGLPNFIPDPCGVHAGTASNTCRPPFKPTLARAPAMRYCMPPSFKAINTWDTRRRLCSPVVCLQELECIWMYICILSFVEVAVPALECYSAQKPIEQKFRNPNFEVQLDTQPTTQSTSRQFAALEYSAVDAFRCVSHSFELIYTGSPGLVAHARNGIQGQVGPIEGDGGLDLGPLVSEHFILPNSGVARPTNTSEISCAST